MAAATNPYDQISYPGHSHRITNPDHLAVLGTLHGMTPALPSRSRVLELGCGVGGNLLPMASRYPDSEFVGVDLSGGEIAVGKRHLAFLGLRNVSLRQADICDIGEEWGRFDYIISHGVYSWVPQAVREAMLRVFSRNLNPQGIAYVSYNAYPWSHLRDMARDIMNFHAGSFSDPTQRVAQGRAILKVIAAASNKDSVYGQVLRDQVHRLTRMNDEVLYHDDLDESAQAFLLSKVVAHAGRHGLKYLCDATVERSDLSRHPGQARDFLEQFSEEEFVAREQFLDFIAGTGFRSTLLCHADLRLRRVPPPEVLEPLCLASTLKPDDAGPNAAGELDFTSETGAVLATNHALTKVALRVLGSRWPAATSCRDLVDLALAETPVVRDAEPARRAEEIGRMQQALLTAALGGHILLYKEAPTMVAAGGERPEASAFARRQAELGPIVTSLWHSRVKLEDERLRRLLMLADGSRDIDRLVTDLAAAVQESPAKAGDVSINRDSVAKHLDTLARMALLVA